MLVSLSLIFSCLLSFPFLASSRFSTFTTTSDSNLIQTQNFTNQFVEVNEIIRIPLSEYFSGQLIKYHLISQDLEALDPSKVRVLYISDFFQLLNSSFVNNEEISNHIDPFMRSTLQIIEKKTGLKMIYFIDRDFFFRKHNLYHYSQGQINEVYHSQLNREYINENCQDLIQIPSSNEEKDTYHLFALCARLELSIENKSQTSYQVFLHIDMQDDELPVFKYLEFQPDSPFDTVFSLDLVVGLRPLYPSMENLYFANLVSTPEHSITPAIVYFNQTLLRNLNAGERGYITDFPFIPKCQFNFSESVPSDLYHQINKVLDFTTFPDREFMFAFIVDPLGLVIQFSESQQLTQSDENCFPGSVATFSNLPSSVGLYHSVDIPNYLYVLISSPASVYEFDISDPYNVYIFKFYGIQQGSERYVGSNVVAVNNYFIVHMLIDVINYQSVLRIYCRLSTHSSVAKFEVTLPSGSRSNFFTFPNLYLNIIWFRDEKRVNITKFEDIKLVIDASADMSIQDFKNKTLNVTVIAENFGSPYIGKSFNVSFLVENDIQVYRSQDFSDFDKNLSVFYNCGEDEFSFLLTNFFNGPNFALQIDSDSDQSVEDKYFTLENNDYTQVFSSQDISDCNLNFLLTQKDQDTMKEFFLLLCAADYGSQVVSYSLEGTYKNTTHLIEIPQALFLGAQYDSDSGVLILMSEITAQWETENIEFHFFIVDYDALIWVSSKELAVLDYDKLRSSDYNQIVQKVIAYSFAEPIVNSSYFSQNIYYFGIQSSNFDVQILSNFSINVTSGIIKCAISDIGLIFMLFENSTICIYQPVEASNEIILNELKRYENFLSSYDANIITFDLIYNEYVVIYSNVSSILVFELENNIDMNYKMKLPLYDEHASAAFFVQNLIRTPLQQPIRSFNNNVLAILMFQEDPTSLVSSHTSYVFLFYLNTHQHNSFIMAHNFTSFFNKYLENSLHLIENQGFYDTLSILNGQDIQIFDLQYFNYLITTNNQVNRKELIEQCSALIIHENEDGLMSDNATLISVLDIYAQSSFKTNSTHDEKKNTLAFNILSQNQGQVITTQQGPQINVSYNQDETSTKNFIFMVETVVQGFNMQYEVSCSFLNYTDTNNTDLTDCSDAVEDTTESNPYAFLIEFVTSTRQVLHAFQVLGFQLMFDCNYFLDIFYTVDYYNYLDYYNMYPLNQIAKIDQNQLFGCNISEFVSIQFISEKVDEQYIFRSSYMIIYQCKVDSRRNIKMALLTIENTSLPDSNLYVSKNYANLTYGKLILRINTLSGQIVQGYPIFDAHLTMTSSLDLSQAMVIGKLITTYNNLGSYSNEVGLYDIYIEVNNLSFTSSQTAEMTSCTVGSDTFYTREIEIIPNSSIAIVVAEDFGAYFIDLKSSSIIGQLSLADYDCYYDQNLQSQGPFMVYDVVGDWPYSIHFITNYGIFIFDFGVPLTDRNQVFENTDQNLQPINHRIIRMNLQNYNYEVVSNNWGYAFLLKRQVSVELSSTYLGSVSFFSSVNSKLFKMMHVVDNQDCGSLNLEGTAPNDSGDEDEISVTFVCGTQLYRRGVCLRPHLVINLTKYSNQATTSDSVSSIVQSGGQLSFNQFNISIITNNCQDKQGVDMQTCEPVAVSLLTNVESGNASQNEVYYICLIITIALAFLAVMLLNNKAKVEIANIDDGISHHDTISVFSHGRQTLSSEKNLSIHLSHKERKNMIKGLDLQKSRADFFSNGFYQEEGVSIANEGHGESDYNKRVTFKTDETD